MVPKFKILTCEKNLNADRDFQFVLKDAQSRYKQKRKSPQLRRSRGLAAILDLVIFQFCGPHQCLKIFSSVVNDVSNLQIALNKTRSIALSIKRDRILIFDFDFEQ